MTPARGAVFVAMLAAGGCAGAPAAPDAKLPGATLPRPGPAPGPPVDLRDREGVWTKDLRWSALVSEIETTAGSSVEEVRASTGLSFARGREPIVSFAAAPGTAGVGAQGGVAIRFVDGVRRPVVRIDPSAMLRGEFRPAQDLPPLYAEGAILAAAGEHEPPAWVARGVALVVGGAFERRLHVRALGGAAVLGTEPDLFGPPATDPLAAAARAKALARIARSEHPFVRFLDLMSAGRTEATALAEMGVASPAFLDAAADTDRARAVRTIADDPLFGPLRAARDALGRGELDIAGALLAPVADALNDPASDVWLVAETRLCLAEIALARGDPKLAQAALEPAERSLRIVRVVRAREIRAAIDAAAAPNTHPAAPNTPPPAAPVTPPAAPRR